MGLADEVERFIRQARVARLATVDEAGQPLVVPICFAWDGTALYSAVDAKPKRTRELRRLQNIRANPKVCVVIDHYEEAWEQLRWVILQGRAEILTGDTEHALDLLREKYPQYATVRLPVGAPVIRVTPTRVLTWSATP